SRMKPTDRRGTMCEWALALGLSLRTTQDHFGPRDGRPRESAAFSPAASTAAEVVDISAAVKATAPSPDLDKTPVTAPEAVAEATTAVASATAVAPLISTAAAAAPAPSGNKSTGKSARKERTRA